MRGTTSGNRGRSRRRGEDAGRAQSSRASNAAQVIAGRRSKSFPVKRAISKSFGVIGSRRQRVWARLRSHHPAQLRSLGKSPISFSMLRWRIGKAHPRFEKSLSASPCCRWQFEALTVSDDEVSTPGGTVPVRPNVERGLQYHDSSPQEPALPRAQRLILWP